MLKINTALETALLSNLKKLKVNIQYIIQIQWWNVTKYSYTSTVYNFDILTHTFYTPFILQLHHISEGYVVLHYIYLIARVKYLICLLESFQAMVFLL